MFRKDLEVVYIEIKFKNGSKLGNIKSKDNKRSNSMRIKFEEWETTSQESYTEVDINKILYYQKHPEEFLELMGHDLHLYWYQKLLLKMLLKIGR